MNKNIKISLIVAGAVLLQSIGGGLAYAAPTGTVTYNGQVIQVNNGQFSLNGVSGTIDDQGMVNYNGQTKKLTDILGVTAYQVQGQAAVPVTPTVVAPAVTGPTGTVTYNGQAIQVTNGQFTLNGKSGTIDANGVVVYDGQTKKLTDIVGVTAYQVQGQAAVSVTPIPTYTSTANKLSCKDYPNICNGDLTIGTRIGDTMTITSQQLKDYFATNPTPQDIIQMAADKKMTTSQVAQAFSIAKGVAYDPTAMINFVRDYPGYALGPDNIIVKLQPGQTKRASDGMLEGTWSSDPGHVSYTDWARAWYCAGNGDVNGGKVDYGRGATTQQCDSSSASVSTTSAGGTSGSTLYIAPRSPDLNTTNPYASSFSQANLSTLDTWINNKIRAKANTMTATAYSTFIDTLVTKVTTLKNSMTDQTKVTILNYILYEVTSIQSGLSVNSTSFLDSLVQ